MKLYRHLLPAAALIGSLAFSTASQAASGSFSCITNNSVGSCGQAEADLSWTFDGSFFSISNAGSGYVAEVYFDITSGVSISFSGGAGTSFTLGANPPSLPGGNTVGFTSDFAFDSDAPGGPPVNGINMGETAIFQITGAAEGDFNAGSLFAGVHVRSLLNGNSESLVTVPTAPIPEPGTYALMLAGLGMLGFMARRRRAD